MSVGSNPKFKRVGLDLKQVVKQVTFWVTVARQKTTKKKVRRAKNGRVIAPRKTAPAGRDKKEQLWKVEDLDKAFDLWERKKDLPPSEKWSKNKISKEPGISYTTSVRDCKEGMEEEREGRLQGESTQPRF